MPVSKQKRGLSKHQVRQRMNRVSKIGKDERILYTPNGEVEKVIPAIEGKTQKGATLILALMDRGLEINSKTETKEEK